ncbi:hypothetical protein N0V88_001473 [Collariella sp. IMI 366227]|nr:hypothetical protein N0V88_001473 [Collariella sp. IMI 366227]
MAGKPAKTMVRPPVIPVLPLNYPQRPPTKQPPVPPATAPLKKMANGVRSIEEKAGPRLIKQSQEPVNRNPTDPGPSSTNLDAAATSAAALQNGAKTELSGPVAAPAERMKDFATSSTFPNRRMESPPHTRRPPGLPYPAPEAVAASGPVHDGLIPAPHPAAMNRPFHQPHPSNVSLAFGGFQDSNASSPTPRTGGSAFPPPGLFPYPPAPVDGYGRPLAPPAVDAYAPNIGNHHGPPTPHSFHGSQSSAHIDEHVLHYPAVGYPVQGPMPPPGMNPPMGGPVHPGLRDQEDTLSFLRQSFSDETFSDCVLEVRFPDSSEFRDHPAYHQLQRAVRAPGHRFVFARSPMLAATMKTQGTMPGAVIFLEPHDEYLRPDVFWYSLRSLYGWSLADGILPTELHLRDVKDDLKTALSYVATARYLLLPSVYAVAVHRASQLLFWNTIELAVKFVSQVVAVSQRNDGFSASELVDNVLAFIVHNFPADFVLDASAGDYGFPRFPPSNPTPRNPNAPTIANGSSSGHSRHSSTSQANMSRQPRLLKQILEHPHLAKLTGEISPTSRQTMIAEVIAEREARRARVLEKSDPLLRVYQERVENAATPRVVARVDDYWVNNLGFKEEVFPGDLPYLVHTWSQATSSSVSA